MMFEDVCPAHARRRLGRSSLLVGLVFGAGVVDGLTTIVGLHDGAHETNRFAREGFAVFGTVPTLMLRAVVPAAMISLLVRYMSRDRLWRKATAWGAGMLVIGWLVVSVHNLTVT